MPADSLFAHRAYLQFWTARLAGSTGNQMMMVAVGWQMYDLTRSAWDLGLVGLLQFLPALLLTLPPAMRPTASTADASWRAPWPYRRCWVPCW